MQLRRCDYCGTEYNDALAQCPLCGKPADPSAPIEDETAPAGYPYPKKGGARLAPKKKQDKIPRGMWIASCAILAVAVLIGAVYFLYAMGLFSSGQDTVIHQPDQSQVQDPTELEQEPVEEQPVEEDPVDDTVRCTGLTLSQNAVVLDERGGYFFLTVLAEPSNCEEPITFTSSDPDVAAVSGNGSSCMITAVAPGEAEIEVTCGEVTEYCSITCDFEEAPAEPDEPEPEDEPVDTDAPVEPDTSGDTVTPAVLPTLSSVDFTLFVPGEQYTLLVNDAPEGADITYTSSDTRVVTITNKGLVTAVGSGSSTLTVKVGDVTLTCIARCNMNASAETGSSGSTDSGDPNATYQISHADVTLTASDKSFQITLMDENGQAVTGESWTSTKTNVCTVDGNGNVTAVATGTAEVQTTYGGKTYSCIVRCHMG